MTCDSLRGTLAVAGSPKKAHWRHELRLLEWYFVRPLNYLASLESILTRGGRDARRSSRNVCRIQEHASNGPGRVVDVESVEETSFTLPSTVHKAAEAQAEAGT